MLLKDILKILEERVFSAPSTEVLFNQYRDNIPGLDLPDGPQIRRENLKNYLKSFSVKPNVLVVGEAAGPWGARFSGIPFTGERQLLTGELPFTGRQSSTSKTPYLERSGSILWRTMLRYYPNFILWNSVPLHPHLKGKPLTIRKPSKEEVSAFAEALSEVVSALKPEVIVAVGRTAEQALGLVGARAVYVRHPSNGGAKKFEAGVRKVFNSIESH